MLDERICAYVEDGKPCDNPPVIHVKVPAPPPYDDLMCEMWLCAQHYDKLYEGRTDENLWGEHATT